MQSPIEDRFAAWRFLPLALLFSAVDLVATYAGRASDLRLWLRGAEINRDRSLRLQYLAGMALTRQQSVAIYEELLRQRRFPDDLFAASPERKEALRRALQGEAR